MFAIHIVLNDAGRERLFERMTTNIATLSEIDNLLKVHKIKTSYVKSIEIIHTDHWNGFNHLT